MALARFMTCSAALFALLLTGMAAQALPSDQEKPIHISSDNALRDEKRGFTVYKGKVKMTQGSMVIEADTVTVHSKDDEVTHIVAVGKPAKFQQRPELQKEIVYANGKEIRYYLQKEIVDLIEEASLIQDGNTLNGARIEYNINNQIVRAVSVSGQQRNQGEQIEMVIPAKKKASKTPAASENTTQEAQ